MARSKAQSMATRVAFFVLAACGPKQPASAEDPAGAGASDDADVNVDPDTTDTPLLPADPEPGAEGSSGAGGGSSSNEGVGGVGFEGEPVTGSGAASAGGASTTPPTPSDVPPGDCTGLPAVEDYGAPGPFADARMFTNEGPNGNYTLFRPDASLGNGGFKHPIATWGNGISTTPDQYEATLSLIASHGFVVIACNDTQAERPCLSAGLDWLVEQNGAAGPFQGKLDTSREVTIGYSWGGGAAIDTADRPNVKATVSLHGMPPRGESAFADMHSPLLLFTSTGDSFVTASGYVTPNFEKSLVQTFYATLNDPGAGHLYVIDEDAVACIAGVLLGACETAAEEQAPTIAWLRYWACDDQAAAGFFFGDDCTLCTAPWAAPRRKQFP
jgi:hypothetical protein